MRPPEGMAPLAPEEAGLTMHAELLILGGHVLMATDTLASMGQQLRVTNNTTICLEIDSREEADRLCGALSEGSTEAMSMADAFWGAHWGECLDRFGVRWMFSAPGNS